MIRKLVYPALISGFKSFKIPLFLLLSLVSINSTVFFLGRTLIPLVPACGVLFQVPEGYKQPTRYELNTVDPAAAFDINFAFDAYTIRSLQQGHIPLWNPYQGLGQPFLANAISAVMYPATWLYLILPPGWWDLVYLLNWFLAALFFSLYLEVLGFDKSQVAIGGVIVLSSGLFLISVALRELIAVIAWWPLLLFAIERTVQNPGWRYRHAILALGVYCSLTGGHPQLTFMTLGMGLIYTLLRLKFQQDGLKIKTLLALLPGSLAGLLLSAPMWVNFCAYAFSAFSLHMEGSKIGLFHLGLNSLPTFIFPYIYGLIHQYPVGKIPGWEWISNPGWLPAITGFLAFGSLWQGRKKLEFGWIFFTLVALVIGAKICGVPGINWLGGLPLLERLNFPRYSAYLLTVGVAGMAIYGLRHLSSIETRDWLPCLISWVILVLSLFTLGIYNLVCAWQNSGNGNSGLDNSIRFALLGAGWAIISPLALYWLRKKYPEDNQKYYLLIGLGTLLQAVAYAPHGFSANQVYYLTLLNLLLFMTATFVVLHNYLGKFYLQVIFGAIIIAVPGPVLTLLAGQGLPSRCNPLAIPPYIIKLQELQCLGRYRSYSFDSALQPNFAAPHGLSSLNNLGFLTPFEMNTFSTTYLDRGTTSIWFSANHSLDRNEQYPATVELLTNLRYYSLISVKFIVTRKTNLSISRPFYSTEIPHDIRRPVELCHPAQAELVCSADSLSRVEVFLSTHRRRNPGRVILQIFNIENQLLATCQLSGDRLEDNSFQEFSFPPLRGLRDKKIRLQLTFEPDTTGSMIAAWTDPRDPQIGFVYRLFSGAGTPETFPLIYEDDTTGVKIWENPFASPRIFLAPSAGLTKSWREAQDRLSETPDLTKHVWLIEGPALKTSWPSKEPVGKLIDIQVNPNDIRATYEAFTPGILTLTDSYAPGWRATINGQEVPVLQVDGIFRGLRLEKPGRYNISFYYRPPYGQVSLIMAGIGLILMIGSSLLSWGKLEPGNQTQHI